MLRIRLIVTALKSITPKSCFYLCWIGAGLFCLISETGFGAGWQAAREEAIALATAGRHQQALVQFEELLVHSPEDPVLNYYAGLCHFSLKDLKRATLYLTRAVDRKAPFPKAFFWLAQAYLAQDEDEKALPVLEEGLERFPRNRDLLELSREVRELLSGEKPR